MMRAHWILAVVSVVLSATPASAELSAQDLLKMFGGSEDTSARLYFRGMLHGFAWSNTVLISRKESKLYCEPSTITLTDEQSLDILRRYVQAEPKRGTYPVPMMMIKSLQEAFPCQQPSQNTR
jgi:hypothetical protein